MSKRFSALLAAVDDYGEFVLKAPLHEHFSAVEIHSGRTQAGRFPATTINVGCWKRALDYFEVGFVTVVSRRLREFLERQRVNAEYIELDVVVWPRRRQEYFFMNLLDVIPCMDTAKSKLIGDAIELDKAWTYNIRELHLDEAKIGDSRMFVMDEKSHRIVRDDLQDSIRAEGFSGLQFRPLPNIDL